MKTYWHFCALDDYGFPIMRDGTRVVIGKRYAIKRKPKLCMRGYHGSEKAIDALGYAPGPWVSKRPLKGVIAGDNKVVGRAYVQQPGIDATEILREFARMCALDVVHLWDAPEVVVQYLKTGDESMRAAAWDAARHSAWSAACDTACNATLEAAWGAAWGAARYAALATARAHAEDAIRTTAWTAALATALATAWTAARSAQNRRLTRMLNRELANGGDMNRRSRHNSHDVASKGVLK